MKINLKRPLLFLDLETTGLNVATDRIVEICVLKLHPDGSREVRTRRINPTIPISPQAQAIHGISNEDVADEPTFKKVAKSLAQWMEGCDVAGYNSIKFDVPMLAEEFLRAVDFNFRNENSLTLEYFPINGTAHVKSSQCFDKDLKTHSAEADTVATMEVLECQLTNTLTI